MSALTIIEALEKLGQFFRDYTAGMTFPEPGREGSRVLEWDDAIAKAQVQNPWFTKDNIYFALAGWGRQLSSKNLRKWLKPYDLIQDQPKQVALILAGNIPLVGLHDLLCVWITGHKALIKASSKDEVLLKCLTDHMEWLCPQIKDRYDFVTGPMKEYDAVLATGSDNTSRYFEYYFGKKPHIIRRNRTGVAILKGNEDSDQLKSLGEDVFRYFGLGCRNVSKLFVPVNYNFDGLFEAWEPRRSLIDHNKYANNYFYYRSVYLMNPDPFLDPGFVLLKEEEAMSTPVACINYEFYDDLRDVSKKIEMRKDEIQVIVGDLPNMGSVPFGAAQQPELWDYADAADTVEFLLKI